MTKSAPEEYRDLQQTCMNCDYWLPAKHQALATDTVGSCHALGSPYDTPRAEQTCDNWESVS